MIDKSINQRIKTPLRDYPPRKFAQISLADKPIARPPNPPKARVDDKGTLR
jgi:hypothetical protein